MNPIRILAVDDDLDFRYLLTQMLLGQPDLELAAVCATAQGGLRCGCPPTARYCPDGSGIDWKLYRRRRCGPAYPYADDRAGAHPDCG